MVLKAYSWPGNIRELRNVIERAVILCGASILSSDDLPGHLSDHAELGAASAFIIRFGVSLKGVEAELSFWTLASGRWLKSTVKGRLALTARLSECEV